MHKEKPCASSCANKIHAEVSKIKYCMIINDHRWFSIISRIESYKFIQVHTATIGFSYFSMSVACLSSPVEGIFP